MSKPIVHPGDDRSASIALEGRAKHTPGPWRYVAEAENDVYIASDSGPIADIYRPLVLDDETRANARLIAAAPELLELLKWAPCPSSMGTASEHYERFYDWLNGPVKAAIAKAEGRS